jgi:N-acetylmuramoyl-L-alanine amidase
MRLRIVLATLLFAGMSARADAADPTSALRTVIVDAGHGGKDPGAVNRWGVREKDITLAVARQLRDYISRNSDVAVVMTRDSDIYLTLDERTELANTYVGEAADRRPSVFVSIHCNAAANTHAVGAETYVHNPTATDARAARVAARENLGQDFSLAFIFADMRKRALSDVTEDLAVRVQDELVTGAHVEDRDVRRGPFYVLFFSAMPSVLVEVGFLTNRDEQKWLASTSGQRALAEAIGAAVLAFGENDLEEWREAAVQDE